MVFAQSNTCGGVKMRHMEPRAILDPETTPAADEKHAPFVQSANQLLLSCLLPITKWDSPPPWVFLFQEASAAHTAEEDETRDKFSWGEMKKRPLPPVSFTYLRICAAGVGIDIYQRRRSFNLCKRVECYSFPGVFSAEVAFVASCGVGGWLE